MSETWDKQEYETPTQYRMFCVYRDMGIDRTIRKVAEQEGKQLRQLETYSAKNHWQSRCNDYDVYLEMQERKRNEKEIIEMNKRHIQQSLLIQKKIIDKLKVANSDELKLGDCARLLDIVTKIERQARGVESGKIAVESKGQLDVKVAPITFIDDMADDEDDEVEGEDGE